MDHIRLDKILAVSDVMCITETWLWPNEDSSAYDLNGYNVRHNSVGKGKGVSVYYKSSKFVHIEDINEEKIQISKFSGEKIDLVVVYRAPNGNDGKLRDHLVHLIDVNRSTMVSGDFNMCYVDNKKNRTTTFLLNNGFKQYVKQATPPPLTHCAWKSARRCAGAPLPLRS